jgi:hypothetical protein
MNRTRRVLAAVVLVAAGGLGASGLAYADDDDYYDDTGRYYDFDHQDYYNDHAVGDYEGNDGCDEDDYMTDGHNGVDSDNGCDTTRYENKGYNGNSSPESAFGHGRQDGDDPLGHELFDNF